MADYSGQINTAYRMISKAGFDITIQRYDTGYDPSLGEVVDVGVTEQTLKAINLPSTQGRIESFDNKLLNDQSLIGKKVRFYVASAKEATFQPQRGDRLTDVTGEYTVIGSTPLSPSGDDILYKIAAFR